MDVGFIICLVGSFIFLALAGFPESDYEKEKRKQEEEQRKIVSQKIAEARAKELPYCSKCGSTHIATVSEGHGTFLKVYSRYNVCQMCGHKEYLG